MKTAMRKDFGRSEAHVRVYTRTEERRLHVVERGDSRAEADGRTPCLCRECAAPQDNDFVRLPGLFRRWEFQDVVDTDADFNVEPAGAAEDGTELFSVYRRERNAPDCQREG
ncbi:hypothetical protein LZ198_41565 [Myxococcus sp. K15C18031901]|uniref:hypothetical protein n=1 Tax=Myxococcus dinghuensis TaxID=2906761 RepID=UPI0020A71218|nr:hypothetical protein [Myxococcus dinghuensis]MCP3105371.1 hypothetical protein [Myxococcus dinghuensis]